MPWQRLDYVQKWLVDGESMSVSQIHQIAKERSSNVSDQTIRKRLNSGESNLDNLIAPSSRAVKLAKSTAASSKKWRNNKKSEMAELIERLGPPKRY